MPMNDTENASEEISTEQNSSAQLEQNSTAVRILNDADDWDDDDVTPPSEYVSMISI